MARPSALLLHHEQQRVSIAVVVRLPNVLAVAGGLPLAPVLLAGPAPEPRASGFQGALQRLPVHPRHHQNPAPLVLLDDGGHQPVVVERHLVQRSGGSFYWRDCRHRPIVGADPVRIRANSEPDRGRARIRDAVASEVEAGASLVEAGGGHGVDIPFPQDEVVSTPYFHLVAVLGVEQHLVARLHSADIGAHRNGLGPGQALAHLGGSRDEDAASGPPLPLGYVELHQDAVVEHLDGKLVLGRDLACGVCCLGHGVTTLP